MTQDELHELYITRKLEEEDFFWVIQSTELFTVEVFRKAETTS